MDKKRDPLHSPTFCMIPWIHLHIMPDASVIPCCVAPYHDHFGNAKKEPLENIWNSDKYRKLRLNMLQGKQSESCQHCYALESSRLKSMRISINRRFADYLPLVAQTQPDGSLEQLNMKYFDIRFSNICNFRCRGCSPTLSSAWYEDHEKLYSYKSDKPKLIECTTSNASDKLWKQLSTLIPHIKEAYFAGGEPLIMDQHYKTLQILLEHGRNDAILSYNTNMSTIKYKNYDLIELWQQFNTVRVSMSIDDIHTRGEYFRKGLHWNRLLKNLDTIREKAPHVTFTITVTVSIYNVYYLSEIFEFFLKRDYIKPNDIIFNMLLDPDEYRIQVLPPKHKLKVAFKLKNTLDRLKKEMPTEKFTHYEWQLSGVLDFLYKEDQSYLLKDFSQRTQALDKIRNESFSKVYPELESLLI